jgi:hypothetical protein
MKCRKCHGRVLLDRIFTDNKNYETACLLCGDRQFVSKNSELGQWLEEKERIRMQVGVIDR